MSTFKKFLVLIGLGIAMGATLGWAGIQMKKEFDDEKPKPLTIQPPTSRYSPTGRK